MEVCTKTTSLAPFHHAMAQSPYNYSFQNDSLQVCMILYPNFLVNKIEEYMKKEASKEHPNMFS